MRKGMIALAVSVLVAAGTVMAQNQQPRANMMRMAHSPMLAAQLKLTDAQKAQIQKIRFDLMQKQIDVRAKIQHARLDYEQLATADSPDEGALSDKIDQIAGLQTTLHKNMLDAWFSVNKILTPDQQKIWKKVLAHPRMAMRGMMMHRMERMRSGGQGFMMQHGNTMGPMEGNMPMDMGPLADAWGTSDDYLSLDDESLLDLAPFLLDRGDLFGPAEMQGQKIEIMKYNTLPEKGNPEK